LRAALKAIFKDQGAAPLSSQKNHLKWQLLLEWCIKKSIRYQ